MKSLLSMGRFSFEESSDEEDALSSKRRCNRDDVETLESEEHETETEESDEEGDDEIKDETREEVGLRVGNRDHQFNFRIDVDVFECSVCFDLLCPPIFQCKNGHIACSSCCPKLLNKCHVCTQFIGRRRCLALEKVIESIKCQCQYFKHGCKVTLSFSEKASHEETCSHAPLFCPIRGCTFSGSKQLLAAHVERKHHTIVKKFVYNRPFLFFLKRNEPFVFLLGANSQLFLLLNTFKTHPGKALFVICIDSTNTEPIFTYDLTVHSRGSSLQLKTSAEKVNKWDRLNPPKPILVVPDNFYTSNDEMHVSVCIHKATGILNVE